MSPIERMVDGLTKRCSHSQPVYQPCGNCTTARLDQISKRYKSELAAAINEENTTVKNQLKDALSSVQKIVDESAGLRKKVDELKKDKVVVITAIKSRDRQIKDLEIQLRAERGSKMPVLDLSEVDV